MIGSLAHPTIDEVHSEELIINGAIYYLEAFRPEAFEMR
jgi:hypothetical protein